MFTAIQFARISDFETQYVEASKKDMAKPPFEVLQGEVGNVKNDILYNLKNLDSWAKDEKATGIPLNMSVLNGKVRKTPYGCCLIIGPFNYPMLCTILPLVGAISAGNSAVVKFSEKIPNIATVLREMVEAALDPDCFAVVQGAIPETQALLAEKWDKIFFTGSPTVGRIIAKAAAPSLTPVTLELGGRNPAIVTKTAEIRLAARRLLWGKTLNAGQVCLSQNYVLVEQGVLPKLITELKKAYAEFFPNGTETSSTSDVAHMVDGSVPRIKSILDNSKGEIILGGQMDVTNNYIAPTVVVVRDTTDSLIAEETFAPILTILPFDTLESALKTVNEIDRCPLALYPFSSSKTEIEKILVSTTSGGVTINDTILHGALGSLEFGGIGGSGTGSYHGKASFDCFTHRRVVVKTPGFLERIFDRIKYPPYTDSKLKRYRMISEGKPNFDRDGNQRLGWIFYLLSLGTGKTNLAQGLVLGVAAVVIGLWVKGRKI
ncbi:putative aldehyde dehydrogenase [Phaeomoniella chlamydospora]|uniref:Aldehyde dehydrogenase n=1 Tax=Phaeomoniella chlamydospora TaxID=158046 RepID=A0A0G2G994_PHACM|nr:putative aldehyde dehydrogenase [Phaeomoniella chlamydospora]